MNSNIKQNTHLNGETEVAANAVCVVYRCDIVGKTVKQTL